MARIPDEVLCQLKRDVSVLRLAEAMGRTVERKGADNYLALCPWHDDHTPSLAISPTKNLFHCLGCGAKGGPIDWVMRQHGVTFRHAVELLQADLPSLAASGSGSAAAATVASSARLPCPIESDADDAASLLQVVGFYHATLLDSPEALAYLDKRGLSLDAARHFQLGYANRTLGYRLPPKRTKAGDELRGRLERLGVYRTTGHEHLNGSLVIPLLGVDGAVVQLYGRKIRDDLRPGTPLHLYLPGPQRGVWNRTALEISKEVILCESLIDALTFWCAGYRNVTCAYGVNGFTEEHLEAFVRTGIQRVLIAFDRDDAGERGAVAVAQRLMQEGMKCYRVQFPHGMDANEYACKVTPARQSLELVLRKAAWLGSGAQSSARPGAQSSARAGATPEQPAAKEEVVEFAVPVDVDDAPLDAAQDTSTEPLATPAPQLVTVAIDAAVDGDDVVVRFSSRGYRVRALPVSASFDLRVTLHAGRIDEATGALDAEHGYVVDRLDLYVASQRARFAKLVAAELGYAESVVQRDLGRLVFALERVQEERRTQAQAEPAPPADAMADGDRAEALSLLRDPDLLERILADFALCGVVGEETNKLLGYIASVSRKLEEPLAVLIQSSSAAGKSSLMEAILQMVPDEERIALSAMTDQSLYYMGERQLKHKVLAIAEEEGASRASYALKLLQSEGELTIASTTKDADTGKLITEQYRVEGPVMLLLTTTAIDIDEELMNRCLVLTVNEEREQTRAIHRRQRERQTLDGLLARRDADQVRRLHRNAQRLLRPLLVANPYAPELSFVDERTRTRRDHLKYLTLIRAIAFLHQHQREVKTARHRGEDVEYIEVTLGDIEVANRLAHQVLGRSLDELAPQTRALLNKLRALVQARSEADGIEARDVRFTRREVRVFTGLSLEQVRIHLSRLVELEYVAAHGGRPGQSFLYELVYAGEGHDGRTFLMGLVDIEALRSSTTGNLPASKGNLPASNQGVPELEGNLPGPYRPQTGGYRNQQGGANGNGDNALPAVARQPAGKGIDREQAAMSQSQSYPHAAPRAAKAN